jgi:dihydrofolate reductase
MSLGPSQRPKNETATTRVESMTKEDGRMRKVLLQMGLSVDGIVAGGPQGTSDAGAAEEDEAVRRWKVESLHQVGTHIMGRVTYEQMAGYWPYNGSAEYADLMNNIPKVVFSKTLANAKWKESRIARGDLRDEIARLKSEPGKDIMVHGGASFVQALSREALIDEYRLVIRPVALGSGMPLFKDLLAPLRLRLIDSKAFADGTAISVYAPLREL